MENHRSLALVTWVGALLQFALAHYSMVLSVSCGVGAFIASIYSIKASRAKAKFYTDKDSKVTDDNE